MITIDEAVDKMLEDINTVIQGGYLGTPLTKSEWQWSEKFGGMGMDEDEVVSYGRYNTVAVRFLRGHNIQKAYTYRVRKGVRLHLGQEVVVPTTLNGFTALAVAVVVEIHKTPQDTGPYNYKFVHGTVRNVNEQ